jgi:hypothetical protein
MPLQLEVVAVDPTSANVEQADQLRYEWRRDDWPCFRITRNAKPDPPFTAIPSSSLFTVRSATWASNDLHVSVLRPHTFPEVTNVFRVPVGSPPQPVVLGWQTNSSLFLPAVSYDDVGTYTVIISGPSGHSVTSAPVHLSVYERKVGSNGGTLSTPIGSYTQASLTVDGTNFNRKYLYAPFDGPWKTTPVSPQFPNPGNLPDLQVSTQDSRNPTSLDTLIQIVEYSYPGQVIAWNNNAAPGDWRSFRVTSLGVNKQYRVAVWFAYPPPAGVTSIYFNWKYSGVLPPD